MPITTVTSQTYNRDSSKVRKAADDGPVFITERGRPAHVLLSIADYQKLAGKEMTLLQSVCDPRPEADFDAEFPRVEFALREVDLA